MEFINNSFATNKILYIFKIISSLYKIELFAVYYIAAIFVYLYYFYKVNNSHQIFVRTFDNFIVIGISYAAIGVIFAILKFNMNYLRPLCAENVFTIISKENIRCLSSFPSGHSAIATLVLFSLYPNLNLFNRIIVVAMTAAVYLSRISLAVHYPADVFYSIILASMIILLSKIFVGRIKPILIKPIARYIFIKLRSI